MLISEAFTTFKAKQKNVQWSVSAINESGELVVSLWEQFFEQRGKGTVTYVDRASRWSGAGNSEFIKYVNDAQENSRAVRAIIARSKQPHVIAAGGAANSLGNTFHPKTDWIGKIILWDGDNIEIEFGKDE